MESAPAEQPPLVDNAPPPPAAAETLPESEPPPPGAPKGEANGIGLGDGRLHLYFELDSHFVHNPTRLPFNTGCTAGTPGCFPPYNDLYFTARPGLEFKYPGSFVDFSFEGDFGWNQYVGLEVAAARSPGDGEGIGLSGITAGAKLAAEFNKEGTFTVTVRDELRRTEEPASEADDTLLKHLSNDVGLALDAKPGGGALVFTLGSNVFYDYYDRTAPGEAGNNSLHPELLDNLRVIPRLKAAWKFLPKTAAFFDAKLIYTTYPVQEPFNPVAGSAATGFGDSFILSGNLGANGYITPRLSAILKGGYIHTFLEDSNAASPSVLAEVKYGFSELAHISTGYSRTVSPTSAYGWFSADYVYVKYAHLLFGMFQITLDAGFSYLDFGPESPGLVDPGNREDFLGTARLALDFFITEWFVVSVLERFELRHKVIEGNPGATSVSNDVLLRVALRY